MTAPDAAAVRVEHHGRNVLVHGPHRTLRALSRRLPRRAWTRGRRPGELLVRQAWAGDLEDLPAAEEPSQFVAEAEAERCP